MSAVSDLFTYSLLMAVSSFMAGLPPLWIISSNNHNYSYSPSFSISLPILLHLTSGLLLSTSLTIVLPEAIINIPYDTLISSSSLIGFQILLGFVLLYSIDTFSQKLNNNSIESNNSIDTDESDSYYSNTYSNHHYSNYTSKQLFTSVLTNSTTLGLLLHCITDGIILTSTILSQNNNNKDNKENTNLFIIIIALFLHKLPAAFSLTSILLNQQIDNLIILFHLFLFAISAPIGAWLSYFIYNIISSDTTFDNTFILLFSTGAFIYVSFHTFISCHDHSTNNDIINTDDTITDKSSSNWNYFATIIGMIIPILVSLLHD